MEIKHYNIAKPKVEKPSVGDWKQCWYGLYRLRECYSDEAWNSFKESEALAHAQGCLGEREMEVDIFLSILKEIESETVTFIELGAGYGDWCMALNGVIRKKLVDTDIEHATCYAVEAEPKHVQWCMKHFGIWKIEGEVIPCIISDDNKEYKFAVDKDPSGSYGQSVLLTDSVLRTAGNLLRRKAITVYGLKLDTLMRLKGITHINMIDMDVQGNEVRVVKGAIKAIKEGRIDYWKVGTHGDKYNNQLKKLLSPYYELVVDVYPYSIGNVDGLKVKVEDGMQVYKRRGL